MERLTRRNVDGTVGISELRPYNYDDFQKITQRLATYEDLEEQGLLLRLPVSDGFTDDLLNMGFTKGYMKAIDKFAEKLKTNNELGYIGYLDRVVDEIAEQMKAGGMNE